jgi:hypothetical protein
MKVQIYQKLLIFKLANFLSNFASNKLKILYQMKKQILFAALTLMAGSILVINGCKKDDETPPTITLNGGDMTATLNSSQPADPGATADEGSVASNWSATNPNMNQAGNYTITYTATDDEGNSSTASRTVRVKNDAEDYFSLGGSSYGTTETPGGGVWTQNLSASSTENNVLVFGKFANYTNNTQIKGKIITTGGNKYIVLNTSPQTATNIGLSPNNCDHTFANSSLGNGNMLMQVGNPAKWTFSMKFTDTVTGGTGTGCAVTGAVEYEDTFLQQ